MPVITPIKVANAGANVPNYDPPAKVLVLGCIDPRYASYLEWFLTHQAGIFGQYDLFVLAGASLGVTQAFSYSEDGPEGSLPGPNNGDSTTDNYNNDFDILHNWDNVFYAHLGIALRLHQITDVWIFDHLDCGAYKLIKFGDLTATDDDILPHRDEINALANQIKAYAETAANPLGSNLPNADFLALNIKGYVMSTNGDIFKVYDDGNTNLGGGYDITHHKSDSNIVVWLVPSILAALVLLFIYFKYYGKK